MLLAVELDSTARSLSTYLRGGTQGAALTLDLFALALGEERAARLAETLGSGSPLRRYRLVEMTDRAGDLHANATVRATPRLVRWLVDPTTVDEEVAPFAMLHLPAETPNLPPSAIAAIETYVQEVCGFLESQRRGRARSDLLLRGPRGAGRFDVAREACRRLGVPLLAAHTGALLGWPNPAEAMATLMREEVLIGGQLLLEGAEAFTGADEKTQLLRGALAGTTRPLLLASMGDDLPRLYSGRRLVVREVPIVQANTRQAIWGELLPDLPSEELASLYRVGVGAIGRVAEGARLRAELRPESAVQNSDVSQAVRSEFATDLGTVAVRVEVSQSWEDLVVPDDVGRTIAELVDQLRHRATVLGKWGFQRKLGKGLGTTALFSGEPGTGKSMVAGLISKTLGLELYQIDLSRVLSKWIGETEKNLAKVFDAAETGHVVLLFDEADALLGKRSSDIKNANDRYANIETNYILQRIEQFHGICILTSNLESSIDPALSRRLSFELRFPFPDVEHRAEIWKRMLPAELPVTGAIDFHLLADRFEIAGGHIRNIVLRAAYLAAAESTSLTMAHLLRAAEYEYRDHGMLVAKGKLKA
jgi:AAA+ superfamily predicted ATPase